MKQRIIKAIATAALLALAGCNALFLCGCQTRVTWEKYPEKAHPIHAVVQTNGVDHVIIVGYQTTSGGFCVTARSPLFARESLKEFNAQTFTNGMFSASIGAYERDLSTNSVVMVKTIFDGSANLAQAVAKAYATIASAGATEVSSSIVDKVVAYFKSKGGDASKSTVTAEGDKLTVTDGTTCIQCDAAGNCSTCSEAK